MISYGKIKIMARIKKTKNDFVLCKRRGSGYWKNEFWVEIAGYL
jgi:hypothetical protein